MADDDDWSDEDVRTKPAAPKVLGTCASGARCVSSLDSLSLSRWPLARRSLFDTDRVKEDYIPPTNKHLTLIQDDLVYVFRQSGPGLDDGMWEGETLGVIGM